MILVHNLQSIPRAKPKAPLIVRTLSDNSAAVYGTLHKQDVQLVKG